MHAVQVLNGGIKQVSFASDIYSMGVVFAEIITGEHPHGRAVHLRWEATVPCESMCLLAHAHTCMRVSVQVDVSMLWRIPSP